MAGRASVKPSAVAGADHLGRGMAPDLGDIGRPDARQPLFQDLNRLEPEPRVKDKCAGNGVFALEVKSPRGGKAIARVLLDGEPRTVNRYAYDVRFRQAGVNSSLSISGLSVTVNSSSLVQDVGAAAVTATSVNWGDGTVVTGTSTLASLSHTYAVANTYVVTISVTTADGNSFSRAQTVTVGP